MNKTNQKSIKSLGLADDDISEKADIVPPTKYKKLINYLKWFGKSEKQNEVEFDNELSSTSTITKTNKSIPISFVLLNLKRSVLSKEEETDIEITKPTRLVKGSGSYKALNLGDIILCYSFPKNLVLKGNLTDGGMSTIDLGVYSPHSGTGGIEVVVKRVKISRITLPPKRNPMISYLATVFDKRSRRQRDLEAEVNIAQQEYTWKEKQIFERTKLEIKALTLAQHCFVVNYYEAFMYRREIYMITERCVGDFRDIIGMKRNLNDFYWYSNNAVRISEVYHVMAPIADALVHLHEENFLHKDLKEQNILLTRTGVPKLCDFGICKEFERNEHGLIQYKRGDDSGSEFNVAPELVKRTSYDVKVDSWGFGITMLTMSRGGCLRVRPGDGMWEQVTDCLKKGLYDTTEGEQDLYSSMLLYDKHNVFNTGEPQKYQEFYQVVKSLVRLNPKDRVLVSDLTKKQPFKEVLANWKSYLQTGKLPILTSFANDSITEFKACCSFYCEKIEKFIATANLQDNDIG